MSGSSIEITKYVSTKIELFRMLHWNWEYSAPKNLTNLLCLRKWLDQAIDVLVRFLRIILNSDSEFAILLFLHFCTPEWIRWQSSVEFSSTLFLRFFLSSDHHAYWGKNKWKASRTSHCSATEWQSHFYINKCDQILMLTASIYTCRYNLSSDSIWDIYDRYTSRCLLLNACLLHFYYTICT